jgi:hypothetical protein
VSGPRTDPRTRRRSCIGPNWAGKRVRCYRLGHAVSLGICALRAVERPDLRSEVSASDRDRPLLTGANGTLMARQTGVRPALMAVLWFSPVLLDSCHPSGRGRRVQASEATAKRPSLDEAATAETIEH